MKHLWSARCLLALLALPLASACDSPPTTNPLPTEDKAAPTTRATPAGAQYAGSVTVSLLCDDAGGSGCAATHYTLDGSAPTPASPAFRDAIALTANTTLKFFSVDKAGNTEAVHTETYTFGTSTGGDTRAPTTSATPAGGFYGVAPAVTLVCDDADGSGCSATHYTTDGSEPTRASPRYSVPVALTGSTVLKFFSVDVAGNAEPVKAQTYTLDAVAPTTTASPVGGFFNAARQVALTCADGAGSGCAATYFTLDGSTPTTQSSRYAAPLTLTGTTTLRFFSVDKADNAEAVRTETYTFDTTPPTVAASVPGDVYGTAKSVALTCNDGSGSGCAAIHFTTDGSTPTAASPVYSAPLNVAASTTLKFFGRDTAGNASPVSTERYVIDTVGPTTAAGPGTGVFNFTVNVTLACDDAGGSGCDATWYTNDGTAPTQASRRYTGPIPVTSTTTLRFFSVDKAGHEGPRGTETYTLDFINPTTTASPPGGNYRAATQVTLTCSDTGGSGCDAIFYATDPSLPTSSYTRYSQPVTLTANTTLKFFSVDKARNREDVQTQTYTLDITPPTTTASPRGGSYNRTQQVAFSCSDGVGTGCAATHYTTDGSTPTRSSPSLPSGQTLPISSNTVLKFFSVDAAENAEAVKTESYLIDTQPPTTTATPPGGTYGGTQSVRLACADGAGTGCRATYYTVDGTVPTRSSRQFNEASPIEMTANTVLRFFSVDNADNAEPVQVVPYTIDTLAPTTTASPRGRSSGGALDVALTCVDTGGSECVGTWYTLDGSAPTEASLVYTVGSPVRVSATATLRFFSKDKVGNREGTQSESYVIDTVRPLVTAEPRGGTFRAAQSVALSCDDGTGTGCSGPIWYTTNGAEPTESSSVYSGRIPVSANTTLKFFSKDAVGNASRVGSETYVIDTVAPTASATPRGRTVNAAVSVTLTCEDGSGSGCEALFYTLDGSVPDDTSTRYTGPFTVSSTAQLRFIARDFAGNFSAVSSETYTFDTTPPTVAASPVGRPYNSAPSVTLTCEDGGVPCAGIYYTLDGSTPAVATSSKYESPLTLNTTTTLKFVGVDVAGNLSPVRTESYLIDTVRPVTTANPPGGNYNVSSVTVELTCADSGGAGCDIIRFTVDGSTPTDASPVYVNGITFSATTTLKFFARDFAGNAEAVQTHTYTLPLNAAETSAQIAAVRAAVDGPVSLPIDKALVTYTKVGVGVLANDPAGFFLQAERLGPAIFVVDPGNLSPAPQPGDRISLVVTQKLTVNSQPRVTTFSNYVSHGRGESVAPLLQEVSNVDLPAQLNDYDSEYLTLAGTITGPFGGSGTGHSQALFTTMGVPQGSPSAVNFRLRVVNTVLDELDLANNCSINLTSPLWRFSNVNGTSTTTQPSAWATKDVQVLSCPAPKVTSALPPSATTLSVRFDRRIAPATVLANGSQFTFDGGLTATSATVVDREVRLTTSTQVGGRPYTVTAAGSLKDTYGSALDTAAASTTFTGYQQSALLRINEVAPNVANGRDLVELYVVQGGNTNNMTLVQDGTANPLATLPAVAVATGDLIVVHLNPDKTVGPILDAPTSETTSRNQYPQFSYSANYDTAWDFHGGTAGITLGNVVLRVKDALGVTQDAVPFIRTNNTNGAFLAQLQALQSEGLWQPATCDGAPCAYTAAGATAYSVSVDWTLLPTTTSRPSNVTMYRFGNADSDRREDWSVGPDLQGFNNSLGMPNP